MNRLLKKYIGILVFLLPFTSFGQKVIRGVVLNYGNEIRVDGAAIRNLRTNQVFISNGLGLFNIPANIGDTLRIAKSGFNEQNIVLTSDEDIIVRLKGITELRAVNVYGITKEQEMQNILNDYKKQGSYHNGKPPALMYIFNPISALYEAFGKTGKRAKRFREYVDYEQDELLIDRKFNKSLIMSLTDLKDSDLTNFMLIYRPSNELVQRWNEYDATLYIKKAFLQYEKNGRPAAPTLPQLKIPELSEK